MNRKRVQRLWREEGLRVPQRKRKRRRLAESTVPAERLRAEHPNHVWAFDFQFDQTAEGRALKLCNIVDEFTREALVMLVARNIDADTVIVELERLVAQQVPLRPEDGQRPGDDRARAPGLVRGTRRPRRHTSIPEHRGRTRSWRASTPACAMSSSTLRSSPVSPRRAS